MSLRPKYRNIFPTQENYNTEGIILSDQVIASSDFLPPLSCPNFIVNDKIGEGTSSVTYRFPYRLAPFPLVVQFQPLAATQTYHLINISSLITQLYQYTPHIVIFIGYYFAPAVKIEKKRHLTPTSTEEFVIDSDSYGLIYEQVGQTLPLNLDDESKKHLVAQLFFTIELLSRYGFNHGDISITNIGWIVNPSWQGRHLNNFTHYGYIIDGKTYYIPSGPIIKLFDFNLTNYDDGEFRYIATDQVQDDYKMATDLAKELLNSQDYQELIDNLSVNRLGWTCLFSSDSPQPGNKIIILGNLPK